MGSFSLLKGIFPTTEAQECWSGQPIPFPADPNSGIESESPELQADSLPTELLKKKIYININDMWKTIMREAKSYLFRLLVNYIIDEGKKIFNRKVDR